MLDGTCQEKTDLVTRRHYAVRNEDSDKIEAYVVFGQHPTSSVKDRIWHYTVFDVDGSFSCHRCGFEMHQAALDDAAKELDCHTCNFEFVTMDAFEQICCDRLLTDLISKEIRYSRVLVGGAKGPQWYSDTRGGKFRVVHDPALQVLQVVNDRYTFPYEHVLVLERADESTESTSDIRSNEESSL